jgi:hypothetical protein
MKNDQTKDFKIFINLLNSRGTEFLEQPRYDWPPQLYFTTEIEWEDLADSGIHAERCQNGTELNYYITLRLDVRPNRAVRTFWTLGYNDTYPDDAQTLISHIGTHEKIKKIIEKKYMPISAFEKEFCNVIEYMKKTADKDRERFIDGLTSLA